MMEEMKLKMYTAITSVTVIHNKNTWFDYAWPKIDALLTEAYNNGVRDAGQWVELKGNFKLPEVGSLILCDYGKYIGIDRYETGRELLNATHYMVIAPRK